MKKKSLILGGVILLVLLLGGVTVGVVLYFQQRQTIHNMTEQFEIQKQDLEDEYEQLAIQYDGVQDMNVRNDSIIESLSREKVKVSRLLEELRTVNVKNVQRIGELKQELGNLRDILKNFVMQIDSLNRINAHLTQENIQVKRQYEEATSNISKISKEKEQLEAKVVQASLLEAVSVHASGLNKRNRDTKSIRLLEIIKVDFTIAKNVTAGVGERYVYVQIYKPDGEVLVKNKSDLFKFENRNIPFSCRRLIIFDGESQNVTLYWNVEEFLSPGTFRVEVFADGNNIGQHSFTLEK